MARRPSQLSLSFPEPPQRGGRRLRAGRKRGRDGGPRHAERPHLARPLPAHVTLRLLQGMPSLRTGRIVHEIERSFADGCARPGFRLVHYALQGNHAHLLVEARDKDALGRGMMALAARVARAVNRGAERHGPVLAGRYHLRLLPTPREVRNALRYVLLNGRRHTAQAHYTIAAPLVLDRASSARWFDGW